MTTSRVSRRTFLGSTLAGTVLAGFPLPLRAQPKTVKIGAIHPVTGVPYPPEAVVGRLRARDDADATAMAAVPAMSTGASG